MQDCVPAMRPPYVCPRTLLPPSSLCTYKQTRKNSPLTSRGLLYRLRLLWQRRLTLICVGSEVKVHGWCLAGSMVLCVSSYRLPVIQGYGGSELQPALSSAKPCDWNLVFHIRRRCLRSNHAIPPVSLQPKQCKFRCGVH